MSVTIVEESVAERVIHLVESGEFPDADAVVTEALDALQREKNLRLVRQLVVEAEESIARGEGYEGTPQFWDEVWADATRMDPSTPLPEHLRP